jgi:hypothetical protein
MRVELDQDNTDKLMAITEKTGLSINKMMNRIVRAVDKDEPDEAVENIVKLIKNENNKKRDSKKEKK